MLKNGEMTGEEMDTLFVFEESPSCKCMLTTSSQDIDVMSACSHPWRDARISTTRAQLDDIFTP